MKKEIIHEFTNLPNIFAGLLSRGKYNIPATKVPDLFIRSSITDNMMDTVFNPYIPLDSHIGCTGLHIFDEDISHSVFYLN